MIFILIFNCFFVFSTFLTFSSLNKVFLINRKQEKPLVLIFEQEVFILFNKLKVY
ncbi:hypothetical protein P615_07425 [Brevibacillus laterosporus PE36]|nr:hypothetical protein P615_07425 [Brevibacillus laterosporus PE36]